MCFVPLVLYLILVAVFKKPLEDVNRDMMEDNSKLTSYLVESIEGIETVKAFNGERTVNLETEKKYFEFLERKEHMETLIIETATDVSNVASKLEQYEADIVFIDSTYLI